MRRRDFITLLVGAAAWPLAARAQQGAMPIVGYLHPNPSAGSEHVLEEFRKGLGGMGWVEGRNLTVIRRAILTP